MNDNDESSSNGNGNGNGNGDGDVAFIADAGTQIIPLCFAVWNVHKSISDTRSNLAASAVLLGVSLPRSWSYVRPTPVPTIDPTHGPTISLPVGVNGIGNTNGTNNINADVAATVDDDDDDDDSDSDSDTDDDMPELEECRHINNRSRHIIGNRRMFVSHQISISQGTNHGTADEEYQSDSSEEPVVELPQ